MATVAEFTIPSDSFHLGSLFTAFPNVNFELERVVPTNHALIPYIWVRGASPQEVKQIEDTAGSHSAVKDIIFVDEVDEEYLLRVEWNSELQGVLKAIADSDVTLVSGRGSIDSWTVELRSDTHDGISTFQQYCRDYGISAELSSLHSLATLKSGAGYDLTDAQREALQLAYERGYYRSPREISLEKLAVEVGITGQSFGSRLRRGMHRLIGSTLGNSHD